jgi:hypothetical protein
VSTIAVVRPESDPVERSLSTWATLLLGSMKGAKGVSTTDLKGVAVTRKSVVNAVTGKDATLFFVMEPRPDWATPPPWWTPATCRASRARSSWPFLSRRRPARPRCRGNGASAFLGFDDLLTNYVKQPSLFGQDVERAARGLVLSGKTVGNTRASLDQHFKQVEKDYRTGGPKSGHPDATVIWMAAHINWRGLVVRGKGSATV